jgi:transglutaminase-like putative cysteine protease
MLLCRSIGIPARATGGYQLIPVVEGARFRAMVSRYWDSEKDPGI